MMTLLIPSLILFIGVSSPALSVVFLSFLTLIALSTASHKLETFNLYASLAMDSISAPLVTLTIWISLLMILASLQIFFNQIFPKYFLAVVSTLLLILMLTFSVSDTLQFYVLFEASLIPTFILILGWGYQPERLQAGIYMMLYTVLASLPLLALLLTWGAWSNSNNFLFLASLTLSSPTNSIWFVASIMAFSVKLPMYITHLWLPKAHVEAPVAGSMVLAGVLLKLGGYGMLRVSAKLASIMPSSNWVWIIWAMTGGALVSLLCVSQTDIKLLIALSSVSHMAMVVSGIITLSTWGVNGAMLIMLGHGFCSSGLFCIANMTYERTHSRSLKIMKGMMTTLPLLTLWWFLLSVGNMAAPPTLNLLGEIHSIISLFSWSLPLGIPISVLVFMAAGYSLFMYATTQHGKPSSLSFFHKPPSPREFLTLFLHWLPLNILVFNPLFMLVQL
nr:NADH dehydrogenase subunit 4 [Isocladus armatus]